MILESKKLFFKKAFVVFEDDKLQQFLKNKKYSSVVGITRNDLNLPKVAHRVKKTSVIDLNPVEDEIFSKFSDTTRNEIRRTYKLPSLKFLFNINRLEVYKLYKKFEYAQKRVPFPKSDMENCLSFSAYLDGEIISGVYVDTGGDDLRIRYIFSKRLETDNLEMYKNISNANRRLVWEICLWGKKNNFKSLDMATVNLTDKSKEGIVKFKMSFGGELADEYTYMYKSKMFRYFEKLATVKNYTKRLFYV